MKISASALCGSCRKTVRRDREKEIEEVKEVDEVEEIKEGSCGGERCGAAAAK